MATPVAPFDSPKPLPQLSYCSKLSKLTEIIIQVAIRVLFIAGSILMTAAAFPLHLHAIAIPIAAFGTTFLASFFFPPKNRISPPFFDSLPPLLKPIASTRAEVLEAILPPDAPRGLINLGQNCPFNSLVHFLEGIPGIAHFLRHPLTPETTMAEFRNFMAEYHPTDQLMADFNAYAAAQNPQRAVPAMFSDFLENYVPPLGELNSFRKIQGVYRNINLLHGTFSHFLAGYDQAVQENRTPVAGTQNLRLAINRITPLISPSEFHQEDAPEILTQILNILPDNYKVRVEQATHYDVGAHPIAELPDAVSRKEDRIGCFTLELKEGIQAAQLEQLFAQHCDYNVEHHPSYRVETDGVRYQSADGHIRRYKPDHTTIRILEPPPVLLFQIKRFYNESNPARSLWSWLIPSWFPSLGLSLVKRNIPVEAPDRITITLANGDRRTYALTTFVNQWGASIESGHYTAAGKKNGQKYFMNDQTVTLADQQSWDERLAQSYLLCYLPVP